MTLNAKLQWLVFVCALSSAPPSMSLSFLGENVYATLDQIGIDRPKRVAVAALLEWTQAPGRLTQIISDPYLVTIITCAYGVCSISAAEELGDDMEDISLTYLDEEDGSNYSWSLAPLFFHSTIAVGLAYNAELLSDTDSLFIMPLAFGLKQLASIHTIARKLAAKCQERGEFVQATCTSVGECFLVLGTAGMYMYSRYFKDSEG